MIIREIEKRDNEEVENLIRTCLIEYDANKPGCAWSDPNLGSFFELYHRKNNLSTTSYPIKGQKRINKEKQSDFKHTYRCMVLVIEEPENVIK